MFTRLPLDRMKAHGYLLEQMSSGHSLCQRLAATVLHAGVLEAIVPATVPMGERDLYAFRVGWHLPDAADRAGRTPLSATASALRDIAGARDGTVIGEALSSRPMDPVLQTLGVRIATLGEEVYFLASPRDALQSVEKMIRRASSIWHSVTVLAETTPPEWSGTRVVWHEADLTIVEKSVRAVAVGAYDDDGYLLWTPGNA
jgi:hypothetical protein